MDNFVTVSSEPAANVRAEVMEGVEFALGGRVDAARERFDELWRSLPADDFFHRCVVAHYMADLQADAREELRWDRLALDAALAAEPESFAESVPEANWGSFLPSLYLNVAASHERLGELEAARTYAEVARAGAADVAETPLGNATRAAIERLCARLESLEGNAAK